MIYINYYNDTTIAPFNAGDDTNASIKYIVTLLLTTILLLVAYAIGVKLAKTRRVHRLTCQLEDNKDWSVAVNTEEREGSDSDKVPLVIPDKITTECIRNQFEDARLAPPL